MSEINFEAVKKIIETNFKIKDLSKISKFEGISPPSVFIGSMGHQGGAKNFHNVSKKYPLLNVGILSPLVKQDDAWIYDDVKYWVENNFGVEDVLKLRNGLLNSRFKSKIQDFKFNKKFVNIAQEIAIASKPVDVEIELKNKLNFQKKGEKVITPHGMNAGLKDAKVVGNVKISGVVDKVVNDELKAEEGIKTLYEGNIGESAISKILSVGVLGLNQNKKLVPTRWSITSTDDILGKYILNHIRDYKWIENYSLSFGEFLGNCYLILFFPGEFNYELFEVYLPGSSWNPSGEIKASTDFENVYGRKNYASNTAGGYYAVRLAVLEYLQKIKRQAFVFVLRIETPSYWAGLGVWVCREACRKALNNRIMEFNSFDEIIDCAKFISFKKFNFDGSEIFDKSKLFFQIKTQKKLNSWFEG